MKKKLCSSPAEDKRYARYLDFHYGEPHGGY